MQKQKKAQLSVGVILSIAIAVIVGLVIFTQIATNVEQGTRSATGVVSASNALYTGVLNTPVEITGQELVSVTSVTNRTSGTAVAAANYTIAECVRSSDGLKGICYTALAAGVGAPATGPVNITYTYYPNGYIDDSAGRAIYGLIILLAALAIAIVVIGSQKWDWL